MRSVALALYAHYTKRKNLAVYVCARFLLKGPGRFRTAGSNGDVFSSARNVQSQRRAVFQIGRSNPVSVGFNVVRSIAHRDADAAKLEHANVIFAVADQEDLFNVDAQMLANQVDGMSFVDGFRDDLDAARHGLEATDTGGSGWRIA